MTTTRPHPSIEPFEHVLVEHGADLDSVHRFDREAVPESLSYATLLNARTLGDSDLGALVGVYEWQESPLAFLIQSSLLEDTAHFRRIRRRLALRGDAPYVAVVHPGRLSIHQVGLDELPADASIVELDLSEEERQLTFPFLGNERPQLDRGRSKWISDVLLTLLDESISHLISDAGIQDEEAISLVGRALFARFLGDRKLLPEQMGDASRLFDQSTSAQATSDWLDATFNGEFLPLGRRRRATVPSSNSLGPLP